MAEKVVIVIQARTGSSRLPGKIMRKVLGKTLLALMLERLHQVKHRATLVVATTDLEEDDQIVEEAQKLKVAVYCGSSHNLLDRHYQAAKIHGADVVLKIPSDCPLIDPRIVDECLNYFFKHRGQHDYVSNLHPATWPDGNDVEIMTMCSLTKAWQNATRAYELEHTTPYLWENPQLYNIGNVSWPAGLDYSMSHRFTIDYEEDYQFIKKVFEELYPKSDEFTCQDVLNLLAQRPDIYELNTRYAGVNWYRHHLHELQTVGEEQTRMAPLINIL